jgi:hypothetical protein
MEQAGGRHTLAAHFYYVLLTWCGAKSVQFLSLFVILQTPNQIILARTCENDGNGLQYHSWESSVSVVTRLLAR